MSTSTQTHTSKTIYVTRTGLPLSFKLEWPFPPCHVRRGL